MKNFGRWAMSRGDKRTKSRPRHPPLSPALKKKKHFRPTLARLHRPLQHLSQLHPNSDSPTRKGKKPRDEKSEESCTIKGEEREVGNGKSQGQTLHPSRVKVLLGCVYMCDRQCQRMSPRRELGPICWHLPLPNFDKITIVRRGHKAIM